jgi:hypothetical protein
MAASIRHQENSTVPAFPLDLHPMYREYDCAYLASSHTLLQARNRCWSRSPPSYHFLKDSTSYSPLPSDSSPCSGATSSPESLRSLEKRSGRKHGRKIRLSWLVVPSRQYTTFGRTAATGNNSQQSFNRRSSSCAHRLNVTVQYM